MQTDIDCCYLYGDGNACKMPAEFDIVCNSGNPGDTSFGCEVHLGKLLGTITNQTDVTWTIVPLNVRESV